MTKLRAFLCFLAIFGVFGRKKNQLNFHLWGGGAQKAKSVGEAQLTLNRQADRTEDRTEDRTGDRTEDRTEDTACLCNFFHGEVCITLNRRYL